MAHDAARGEYRLVPGRHLRSFKIGPARDRASNSGPRDFPCAIHYCTSISQMREVWSCAGPTRRGRAPRSCLPRRDFARKLTSAWLIAPRDTPQQATASQRDGVAVGMGGLASGSDLDVAGQSAHGSVVGGQNGAGIIHVGRPSGAAAPLAMAVRREARTVEFWRFIRDGGPPSTTLYSSNVAVSGST